MNDKYAKEIAKELRLIRIELQKVNKPSQINIDGEKVSEYAEELMRDDMTKAGDRVTIK